MRIFEGFVGTALVVALILAGASACSRAREYELRGQVLAVDPARREMTVRHEDIRGFMPGMTMAFRVDDAPAFASTQPGDVIRATLVVEDAAVYLKGISKTGHAPLADASPRARIDLLQPGEPVPDAVFVDSTGAARRLSDWKGIALAVTFIYTRCPVPNFCPLMDRHFAEVQRGMLEDPRLADRAHLLSISFDPAYDTPAVLAAHATKVGANPRTWTMLTGARSDIEAFGSRFGVSIVPDESSAPEIVHNLRTAVIDPQGRLVKIFNGSEWNPGELLDALKDASGAR
jgi:protein SCO1